MNIDIAAQRIGETVIAKNGLRATITEYNSNKDITAQFEDGTIVKNTTAGNFDKGLIAHPKYYKCKEAYKFNNEKYFVCTCRKCKGKHVLRLSEMKDFECKDVYV